MLVDLRLVVEYHQMAQRRTLQSGLDSQIQICRARGEHPRLDLVDDRFQYRDRGVVLQWHRHQAEVGAHQLDSQIAGPGETDSGNEVARIHRRRLIAAPCRSDRAHLRPQVAVADGLESGQQPRGGAASRRVEHQLSRALPECGPIRVAPDERLDHLGQPKSGPACRVDHVRDRFGGL